MSERAIRWEIYQDQKGEFRFRYRAGNGEIICSSEGYVDKSECNDGIDAIELPIIEQAMGGAGSPAAFNRVPRIEVEL